VRFGRGNVVSNLDASMYLTYGGLAHLIYFHIDRITTRYCNSCLTPSPSNSLALTPLLLPPLDFSRISNLGRPSISNVVFRSARVRLCLFLHTSASAPEAARTNTPRATPTPIPTFAPLESPFEDEAAVV